MRTLLAFLLLAVPLGAQAPYLVKDINTTYSQERASSNAQLFTAHGSRVYFIATTKAAGTELWSTDGTNTAIVADVIPGEASSNPGALRSGLGQLLFNARDVDHGTELWTTDGTAAGTKMLIDINPGPNSSEPATGVLHNNRWIFAADNGTNGRELWITDGTAAGTRMVKDLEPGVASSSPRAFAVMGNAVYFVTSTGLWKTDGTEAGTTHIAALLSARNLTTAGNRIFFEGFTSETNWELWVSDGTQAGTRMLPEILPGVQPAFSSQLSAPPTVLGNRVVFAADDGVHGRELWVSDGTDEGTHLLLDMIPGATGAFDQRGSFGVLLGDRLYFTGLDAEHGRELWSTDGTAAGTRMTFDLLAGPDGSGAFPTGVVNGKLFFVAYIGGARLWITDGTQTGTRQLNGHGESFEVYAYMRVTGNRLYFAGSTELTGNEPWVSDGTDAGTHMLANIGEDGAPSANPRMFAAADGLLFFHATEGLRNPETNVAEASLWRTDGTASGTFKLLETGQHPPELTAAGRYVFFKDPEHFGEWLISDGTLAGTQSSEEFRRRFGGGKIHALHPFGDDLFVEVGDSYGTTLWKTTPAPYMPATRLTDADASGIIEAGGRYMFFAEKYPYDVGLWITDGTPAGTHPVVPDLHVRYNLSPLAAAQGQAFFLMQRDDEEATKLWKSDGTLDGTVAIKDVPGASGFEIDSTGRRIFIIAGNALWTSDGTEAGTIELAKVKLLGSAGYEDIMKVVGDRVVFVQYDYETSKRSLWGSDGTVAGTKMLMQVYFEEVASIDGVAYFAGGDDAHGIELWTTDGTPEGTKMLLDHNPGPANSSPANFTKMGDEIYFSAYTQGTGNELWALPLTASRANVADAYAGENAQTLRFTVTLSRTSQSAVNVSYTTADLTAHTGQDYVAASGSLTFAPGELSKHVDIQLLGDTAPENNETFSLSLSNGVTATGLIEDDDTSADLGLSIELGGDESDVGARVRITNHGPRGATEVEVEYDGVPNESDATCYSCRIPQIANGDAVLTGSGGSFSSSQAWRSATVHARQSDPNSTNDTVSWTVSDFNDLVMDAAYLTPGQTAHVAATIKSYGPPPTPASTDDSVVSISSPVTGTDGVATFTVTAHKPGTVTLTVGQYHASLAIIVVPAGTSPRWPNGVRFQTDFTAINTEKPVKLTIERIATAPLTGAAPTGDVVVTANGQQLARVTITGKPEVEVPLYFRWLGNVNYEIAYAGDANFLPVVVNRSVYVYRGTPTVTGQLLRTDQPNTYQVKVRVSGAPGAAPTGIVQIFRAATMVGTMTLTPSADGTSAAEGTVTNLPGDDVSVFISYVGDTLYEGKSQEIRFFAPRRRGVHH